MNESQRHLQTEVGKNDADKNLQWQLEGLKGDIVKDLTREQLSRLESGIQQQDFLRADQEDQTRLLAQIEGTTLENDEAREVFFGSLEQRLTVLLVLLIRSRQLNYQAFTTGNQQGLLDDLRSRKDQLRIGTANGNRELLPQENTLLDALARLPNHSVPKVRETWVTLLSELKSNVRAMGFAADIVSATDRGEAPQAPGNASEEEKGIWKDIKDQWEKIPPGIKRAALITAAVGGGIYLLNKLFNSESGGSSFSKLLGVGALIAGGVYIAGKFMSVDRLWGMFRGKFDGLNQEKFMEGLAAFKRGDLREARRIWGSHSDEIMNEIRGETREVTDENGIQWVRPKEALKNYMHDMGDSLLPVTSWMREHSVELTLVGGYLCIRNFDAVKGGLSSGYESLVGFAHLLGSHPIRSTLILSAFFVGLAEADERFLLPKNGQQLKLLLTQKRQELAAFLEREGFGPLSSEQLEAASKIISGEEPLTKYKEQLQDLTSQALTKLTDKIRLTPVEKIRMENARGFTSFIDQLKIQGMRESEPGKVLIQQAEKLLQKIQLEGGVTMEEIDALRIIAQKASIDFLVKDGYIYWGRKNNEGKWVDQMGAVIQENQLRCLAVNPNLKIEEQYEAANRFLPNPESIISALGGGFLRRPFEQLRNTSAEVIEGYREGLLNGTYVLVVEEGGTYLMEGATQKYFEMPKQLLTLVTHPIHGQFSAKEFIFEYGEGMVPVMVLGVASSLGNLRLPTGFGRALLETAFYPITGASDVYRFSKTRMIGPFFQGAKNGETAVAKMANGFAEVGRHNIGIQVIERYHLISGRLRALRSAFGGEMRDLIRAQDSLREALSMLRSAEGGGVASGMRIDAARRAISNSPVDIVKPIANTVSGGDANMAIETVQKAIKYFEDLEAGMSTLQSLKAGKAISPSELQILRNLSKDDTMAEVFRNVMKQFGVAEDKLDLVRNALKSEEGLDVITNVFRQANILGEGLSETNIVLKGAAEAVDAARATSIATEVARTGSMRAAAEELLRASRGATNIHPAQLEGLRSLANAHPDDLRGALKALDLADDQIEVALRALTAADQSQVQLFAALQEAKVLPDTVSLRVAISESQELNQAMKILAEGGDLKPQHFEALQQLGKTDEAADVLKAAGVPAQAADEIAATLKTESSLNRIVSRMARVLPEVKIPFASGLIRIAKFAPPALAAVGAVAAIWEARQQYALAEEFKSNPDVVAYLKVKAYTTGTVGVVGLAADIGITIAVGASAAAVPLILLTGSLMLIQEAVVSAMEAAAEQEMEADDFYQLALREGQRISGVRPPQIPEGQRPNAEQMSELMMASMKIQDQGKRYLLHQWYTTGNDLEIGERTLAAYSTWTTEDLHEGRSNTRSDMIQALIKLDTPAPLQKDPVYMGYRFKYITAVTADLNVESYAQAQLYLAQSKVFADTMRFREVNGQPVIYRLKTGPDTTEEITVSEVKYNLETISSQDVVKIFNAVSGANTAEFINTIGNPLFRRISSLDPNYLQFSLNVLQAYLQANIDQKGSNERYDRLDKLSGLLEIWMRSLGIPYVRSQDAESYFDEEIEGVEKVLSFENLSEEEVRHEMEGRMPNSPGTAAFYILAQYFGYTGMPNIGQLRLFFNERNAARTGVYWDGKNWRVNETWDYDDNSWRAWVPMTDSENTNVAAQRVIAAFRAEPDEIIESDRDSALDMHHRDDLERRIIMVNALANRMQSAYDTTRERLGGEGETRDVLRSPTAEFLTSLPGEVAAEAKRRAEATAEGARSFVANPTEGLRMAGEQAVEELSNANRSIVNSLDRATGGEYSRNVNNFRSRIGSVLSSLNPFSKEE